MATNINFSSRDVKVATISGAYTVTAKESGTTFILDAAAGAAITLPTLAPGLNFHFVVGSLFATSDWVISSAEGDNINGLLIVNGASVPAVGEDNVTFELGAEAIGDHVQFVADPDNSQWWAFGAGAAALSISANDPA